jgi:membrane fusion protein (multidrug efflux system)
MQVTVDTHNRDGAVLASQPRSQPAFSTTVYDAETHAADALIAQIISANLVEKTASKTAPRHLSRSKKH